MAQTLKSAYRAMQRAQGADGRQHASVASGRWEVSARQRANAPSSSEPPQVPGTPVSPAPSSARRDFSPMWSRAGGTDWQRDGLKSKIKQRIY